MFKSASESIQKQLDNPKISTIKLHGVISEPLLVKRSVVFTGSATLNAPLVAINALEVKFENANIRLNSWGSQIGVDGRFKGHVIFDNTVVSYGDKLIKTYIEHANTGEQIPTLVVINAPDANTTIINSQITNASIACRSATVSESEIGLLFGPMSSFYTETLSVDHSSIHNCHFNGQLNLSNLTTTGDLRLTDLNGTAKITKLMIEPVPINEKRNSLYPLQQAMQDVYRIQHNIKHSSNHLNDDPILINVLTISGDAKIQSIAIDENTQDLIDQYGYGLALINLYDGDVSLSDISKSRLEYTSVTGGDLKISGKINEPINKINNGRISYIDSFNSSDALSNKNSALYKLNQMIGLDPVKDQLKRIIASATMRKKRHQPMPSLHMIFSGNAGTGKTTVADIFGLALFENGVIPTSKVVRTTKKDLVAGYVGQTAQKTSEVIQKAYGGVLFIDEAYTLASDSSSNGFEAEAIGELIAQMEDHKDNLIVILAGYTNEMKTFVNSNQGINSRIKTWIEFPDYSINELTAISKKQLESAKMTVTPKIIKYLKSALVYMSKQIKLDGNGRFARNFTDTIIENYDSRIFDGDKNTDLTKSDILTAANALIKRANI